MAVRDFHASLYLLDGAKEVLLIPQEATKVILDVPTTEPIKMDDGWTIREPLTNYRWFMFYLEISPKDKALLSRDHFLRIMMDAIGQDSLSQEFYVDNWHEAQNSNSSITMKSTII